MFPNNQIQTPITDQAYDVQLKRGFMWRVPTQHAEHFRPYQTSLNERSFDQLRQATNNGRDTSASALASVARQVLAPAYQTHGQINIDGGWAQERFAFIIEFQVKDPFGHTWAEVLSGYTNYDGADLNGNVDPGMHMHVNAHTRFNYMNQGIGPQANGNKLIVADSFQLIKPIQIQTGVNYSQLAAVSDTMRPVDALRAAMASEYLGANTARIDSRLDMTGTLIESRRVNNSSARYLGRVFDNFRSALDEGQGTMETTAAMLGNAGNMASEPDISRSSLLSRLISQSSLQEGGFVSYGELMTSFGWDADRRIQIAPGMRGAGVESAMNYTQTWDTATEESAISLALTHQIPTLMMQNLVSEYSFTMHNMNGTGIPLVTTTTLTPLFPDLAQQEFVNQVLERAIANTVIPELMSNIGNFDVTMSCHLMGNSNINISLDGRQQLPFLSATYADHLTAPVMANDAAQTARIGHDITNMVQMAAYNTDQNGF